MAHINSINFGFKKARSGKEENKQNVKGTAKALLASQLVPVALSPIGGLSISGMQKVGNNLSKEEKGLLSVIGEVISREKGMYEKGVRIFDIRDAKSETWTIAGKPVEVEIFNKNTDAISQKIPKPILEFISPYHATKSGKNAFFAPKPVKDILSGEILQQGNSIGVNKGKLPTAIFHELGHAFNYNCSKTWRRIQKMRLPAMGVALLIPVYCALTKKSEAKDGCELTKGQKVNNFVRNNSGKLAVAAMLPVIAEEVMASIRGCKWASEFINNKKLPKAVLKTNLFGAISYTVAAIGVGLGAYYATKIKDESTTKNK